MRKRTNFLIKKILVLFQIIYIHMSKETVMTSVKVQKDLYEQFKNKTNKTKFYLQDLVNRSMNLYLTDEDFRKKIEEFSDNTVTDSSKPFTLTPLS